jgi:hypothetical protein
MCIARENGILAPQSRQRLGFDIVGGPSISKASIAAIVRGGNQFGLIWVDFLGLGSCWLRLESDGKDPSAMRRNAPNLAGMAGTLAVTALDLQPLRKRPIIEKTDTGEKTINDVNFPGRHFDEPVSEFSQDPALLSPPIQLRLPGFEAGIARRG